MLAQRPRCLGAGALRRRSTRGGARARSSVPLRSGFHPLSDLALEELIAEMEELAELCEARFGELPAAGGRILLLVDECDHLIQQQYFQQAVADVLRRCSSYRIVLSTQQRMVGTAGGCFKVVHQELHGLASRDAARLFLHRAHRPLRWDELLPPGTAATKGKQGPVRLSKENEQETLSLLGGHPCIVMQRGNPRKIIELACKLSPSLPNLWKLAPPQAIPKVDGRFCMSGPTKVEPLLP